MRLRRVQTMRRSHPGPYWKTDRRSKVFRAATGWVPRGWYSLAARWRLARWSKRPLRDIVVSVLHPAWYTVADREAGERMVAEHPEWQVER